MRDAPLRGETPAARRRQRPVKYARGFRPRAISARPKPFRVKDPMNKAERFPIFMWLLAGAAVFLVGAIVFALRDTPPAIDPKDQALVAEGKRVYDARCASCHGAHLVGQANWRQRLPTGRLPAPPHDPSGHTWHHPDALLFGIVKEGLVPGKYAPPRYESDMPAFGGLLSDEQIRAALAYIKSTWPEQQLAYQREMDRNSRARR